MILEETGLRPLLFL